MLQLHADPNFTDPNFILLMAKERGLIPSFHAAVTQMQANGIFYHPTLVEKLRRLAGE